MWFSSSFLFRFFFLYCVFFGVFFYPMSVLCLLTTYHVSNTRHGWGEMHAHSDFVLFKSRQVRDTQVNVLVTPSVTARKRSTLHRLNFNSQSLMLTEVMPSTNLQSLATRYHSERSLTGKEEQSSSPDMNCTRTARFRAEPCRLTKFRVRG